MQFSEFQLFQILREKVGDEQAKTLAEHIGTKVEKQGNPEQKLLISKLDLDRKLELSKLKTEFYLEINKSKIETIQLLFFVVIVLILISTMLVGFSR